MEMLVRKPGSGRPTHDEGDVFQIYPHGTCEKPSRNSVYWLIKTVGEVDLDDMGLIDPNEEEVPLAEQRTIRETLEKETRKIHRRKQKLDFAKLPASALAELQIKNFCYLQTDDFAGLFVTK